MNQIVKTLISALGISRRDQATDGLKVSSQAAMTVIDLPCLALIAGGDDFGPRGGWKDDSTTTA